MYVTAREYIFEEKREKLIVPVGFKLIPMTRGDVNNMKDPSPYIRMRQKYRERGEDGIYALFKGKYRWFNKEGLEKV